MHLYYPDMELQALQDVTDYMGNPRKTEERLYVMWINVSPEKLQYCNMYQILSYHGYQSFLWGEVTPDQAKLYCVYLFY